MANTLDDLKILGYNFWNDHIAYKIRRHVINIVF